MPKHPGYPPHGRQRRAPWPEMPPSGPSVDLREVEHALDRVLQGVLFQTEVPPWGGWMREARDFDVIQGATVTGGGSFEKVAGYSLKANHLGVLAWWGADVADVTGWSELTWQVRLNGAARPSLTLSGPPAFVGLDQHTLRRVHVAVVGGDEVSVWAKSSTNNQDVCACVKGWVWPQNRSELS